MHIEEYEVETVIGVLTGKLIVAEARFRALEELLVETGLISGQAIVEKYKLVLDRDGEKISDELYKTVDKVEEITANES